MTPEQEAVLPPFHELPTASLLAALGGRVTFVLLESSRVTPDDHCSYLFIDPVEIIATSSPDEVSSCLDRLDGAAERGLWAAGFLAYELGYCLEPSLEAPSAGTFPLLWQPLFPRPHIFDHYTGTFDPPLPFTLPGKPPAMPFTLEEEGLNVTAGEYEKTVDAIHERIAAGDTYQVNYTMKYRFTLRGSSSGLYLSLRHSQPVSYSAFLKGGEMQVLSLSPELFLRKTGAELLVRPMKGTSPRGATLAEDRKRSLLLAGDGKNRAENVMIVDLLRNDLGRICLPGTVKAGPLFTVEHYDTLLQMTSTVTGIARNETPPGALLKAIFPCGSVTGAPKIRTMEIIRELEKEARNVYCGAIGFFAPSGDATLSVPIRTVLLDESKGELGLGSGIVEDSHASAEYDECLLKGAFLTRRRPSLSLIETLYWDRGSGFFLFDKHVERLAASAAYFGIPFSIGPLRRALDEEVLQGGGDGPLKVRLLVSRGGAIQTFSEPVQPIHPVPPTVRLSRNTVDSSDPHLYHKTTRRTLYESELAAARRDGIFEVLFTNERGEVTEGSFTNIFIERDGVLLTPPVDCGLLNGTFRRHLLETKQDTAREAVLSREELVGADRLFICNSVRRLVPVTLSPAGL